MRDLVRVRRQGHHPVLVTSGAIACGIGRLGMAERPTRRPDLQAASAVGQGVLFQRYAAAFAPHDVVPAQILLTSRDLAVRGSYLNARTALRRLLDMGAVPVINENDTTATDELTFGDNDVLAAQVAILLGAAWLLLLTERDGLYAATGGGAELIGDVPAGTRPDELALADIGGAPGGRGGIGSKVASASMATGGGVTTRDRVRDRGRGHPRRRLGAPRGHPLRAGLPPRGRVQALAALREAGHGPGRGRRRRGAGPARARHLAAGGRGGRLRGRLPGRRRRGGDLGGRGAWGRGSRRCPPTRCARWRG